MTISGKCEILYELSKKLNVARKNGLLFIQINKLTKNIDSNLR